MAGLLIDRRPKAACYIKNLKPLNSYFCQLSKMVYNFFVSSISREIWEFKNLGLEYEVYRKRRFHTGVTGEIGD